MDLHEPSGATIEQRANVLALIGDFDLFSAGDLEARINDCAASGEPLLLDLSQCTYVDSTILTVLVRATNAYGSRLEIIAPQSGNVARVLSITKLDRFLPLV